MAKPIKEKNINVPDHIVRQLLTLSELRMLKNRWQIIQYLQDGLSIRKVARQVQVGTDTVVRVARMMENSNLRKVLDKKTKEKKIESRTPWIFGKSG